MSKKVFSMADLSSAVNFADNDSCELPGRKAHVEHKKVHQHVPTIEDDDDDIGVDSDAYSDSDEEDLLAKPTLPHTAGSDSVLSKASGMKKSMSSLDFLKASFSGSGDLSPKLPPKHGKNLLVVFDMDHTMVGDLVALSDRDNIETNVPWTYWPEGKNKGLSPEFVIPYLQRGMLRPGLLELITSLRGLGATIVVYTHSEEKWAIKVCEAMERVAGMPFIKRIFSRMDCKDGHPEFTARKSLEFVVREMKEKDGLHWAEVDKTIFFDDDGNAVNKSEQSRLVKVASYDYWEPCQWDEVVNEPMMRRNPPDLADMVRRSVVEWGIAPPSYIKGKVSADDAKKDARWAAQLQKKESILLSFNKVAKLDRVMFDIRECIMKHVTDLEMLPERVRSHLGNTIQPQSRRRN